MSWFFDLGIIVWIVLNVILMAMERYPMNENISDLLMNSNLVMKTSSDI